MYTAKCENGEQDETNSLIPVSKLGKISFKKASQISEQ